METTLTILNHKLKRGVTVHRTIRKCRFFVNSFGSELNQVWTNFIDNAIDAMGGKGELRVRTFREDNCVVVEIGDNGPGISPEVYPTFSNLFHDQRRRRGNRPGPGHGPTNREKTSGQHSVDSKPGDTRFQVWLPLSESASRSFLFIPRL